MRRTQPRGTGILPVIDAPMSKVLDHGQDAHATLLLYVGDVESCYAEGEAVGGYLGL